MRKLDPVRHEEKRQEILAAANRCFERSGLKGASISHICKEAGISPGHLYHYFDSKDAIIATLSEAWLSRTRERFELLSEAGGDVVDTLITEIGSLAPAGHNSGSELVFEMLAESTRNPTMAEMVRSHSDTLRTILANVLRNGQAQGTVAAALDADNAATVIIAMVDGLKALMLRTPEADRDAAVGLVQKMLQGVLELNAGGQPPTSAADHPK